METDIIEVRASNYFARNNAVLQITERDLANIQAILPELRPLSITPQRLVRLNFSPAGESQNRMLQKICNNFCFDFHRTRTNALLLVLNQEIRLKHILNIHQLQNLYYDLTGELLLRQEGENPVSKPAQPPATGQLIQNTGGAGKYRAR
ncbi:hypothetical protein EXU57_06270 [Segetibacter sp. 3557_3]|uniref:hypothetical protein n=1 Tax=Segetibacter sp. 3557_3 TaxID=2547429 RepID=UPI0010583BAC|nr:hypothetical protein [Segetibacter sp. 3557_3]TDH28065.1 hypothetical protein EXU57_06270 [Segetibacter sp. 3557_3]